MKRLLSLLIIVLAVLFAFFPSYSFAKGILITSSTAKITSENKKWEAQVYFKGYINKNLSKVRLVSVHYKIGPGDSSSDKNNIRLGSSSKYKSTYYSSPDSLLRKGLSGNFTRQKITRGESRPVPFLRKLYVTVDFDKLGDDPEYSGKVVFNWKSF